MSTHAAGAARAIVLATGDFAGLRPLVDERPAHLFPVLGKPFVQYVIETLVERGAREIHVFVDHLPELTEAHLGDGQRWSARIEHHLVASSRAAYRRAALLARRWNDGDVVLARAQVLPRLPSAGTPEPATVRAWFLPGEGAQDGVGEWSGWCSAPAALLAGLPRSIEDEAGFLSWLRTSAGAHWNPAAVDARLDVRTWAGILAAQRALFEQRFPELLLAGREVEPGVRLSRNVALHPSARIVAPVFIGADTRVDAGATIGPFASLSSDCIVAERAVVQDAVVCAHTYVGPGLALERALVDRNCLVNVDLGVALPQTESFLLGDLGDRAVRRALSAAVECAVGALCLAAFLPVLLLAALALVFSGRRQIVHRRSVVRLPALGDRRHWRSTWIHGFGCAATPVPQRLAVERFLLLTGIDRWPQLFDVVCGRSSLTGVAPRSADELAQLDGDWQALCLRNRVGLATLVEVRCWPRYSSEEAYACEAFHSARRGLLADLRTFARWLMAPKPSAEPAPASPAASSATVIDRRELFERFADDREFLAETIAVYLEGCDADLAAITGALAQGDVERVSKLAHKLKGSVSVFAAPAATAAAAKLERIGRERDLERAEAALRDVQSEVRRLQAELRELQIAA